MTQSLAGQSRFYMFIHRDAQVSLPAMSLMCKVLPILGGIMGLGVGNDSCKMTS